MQKIAAKHSIPFVDVFSITKNWFDNGEQLTIDGCQLNDLGYQKFAKLIADNTTNKLWSFTSDGLRYLSPGALSDKPNLNIIPVKKTLYKGASGFENIIHLENEKYFLR